MKDKKLALLVKGDRATAEAAAIHRGLSVEFVRELRRGDRVETVLHTGPQEWNQAADWFVEQKGFTVPPGGLLFYQLLEEQQRPQAEEY